MKNLYPKLKDKLKKLFDAVHKRNLKPLFFIGVFAIIGTVLLLKSNAATPFASVEPENGSCSGNVTAISDTTASGGKSVQFGTPGGCASALSLTGLDTTIRANWVAPTDPGVKWQVASAWTGDGNPGNGSKLVGSKVLSATANVADMNGLRTDETFTIKIQNMNSSGVLSEPITATATTTAQSPIANAAYFDNFNDATIGPLNSNYYDVRATGTVQYSDTANLPDTRIAFAAERHFHGQVIESQGQGGIMIRSRVPATLANNDGSPRTMTFQTEVDMPPIQGGTTTEHGKWFEIHFSRDIAGTSDTFGATAAESMPNAIRFAIDRQPECGSKPNTGSIRVNIDGRDTAYCGDNIQHFSPGNVRVPVVIKLSQTSAELFINGKSAAKATGFKLPFTKGYWTILDSNYRSAYDGTNHASFPTITNSLTHWDMMQFDGPAGSYNPVVKTYIQNGCSGFVIVDYHSIRNCAPIIDVLGSSGNTTVNIPAGDDLSKLRSVKMQFSGSHNKPVSITMNGKPLVTLPASTGDISNSTQSHMNEYEFTAAQMAQLQQGNNTFGFSSDLSNNNYNVLAQLELEAIYNIPRTISNPVQDFMPMLGVTNSNMRYDHIVGQPNIVTGTTYVYASGADMPTNYNIEQINRGEAGNVSKPGAATWFSIQSPTSGSIKPLPAGGQLIPINFTIDFSKYVTPSTGDNADSAPAMGVPAVLKITGGAQPVYVAILAVKDQITSPIPVVNYTFNENIFNRAALP